MNLSNLAIISSIIFLLLLSIALVYIGTNKPSLPDSSGSFGFSSKDDKQKQDQVSSAQKNFIIDLQYPNSEAISSSIQEITYESSDQPADITNWYKEKIKDMRLTTVSSVQTNTDGYILNKIVAGNRVSEVKITITRDRNQTLSTIILEESK